MQPKFLYHTPCVPRGQEKNGGHLLTKPDGSKEFFTYPLSLSGPCQEDVAASTSVRHAGLSQARRLAADHATMGGKFHEPIQD